MVKLIKKSLLKIIKSIELSQYDDFTIADYFRKQGAQIGEDNRIEVRSMGTEPFLISIGNHCTIGQYVSFLTHDGAVWVCSEEDASIQKFGKITIHDNCFIGSSTIIIGNVTIGPNTIVGAGSVVTKDIPANVVAAGVPARIIRPVSEYKDKVMRIWKDQKPVGYMSDIQAGVKYSSQDIHRLKYRDLNILRNHLKKLLLIQLILCPQTMFMLL